MCICPAPHERLLPEAQAVLAAAHRTRQVAADIVSGDDGLLRLGSIQGPGDRIYRLLNDLAAAAPRLQVRLRRLPLTDRLAAVRSGQLDAALVRALPATPGLELLPVWSDPLYVALPDSHPLAARPVLRLEQLADLPLRLAPRENNPPFHDLITDALRSAGTEPIPGPPFTSFQETLTAIGTSAPSWTVFYDVVGLPPFPRVALRPLARPTLPTSLAVRPGPPAPHCATCSGSSLTGAGRDVHRAAGDAVCAAAEGGARAERQRQRHQQVVTE